MEQEKLIIRLFGQQDRPLVEAFVSQMGGETRAFFDRNGGNSKGALSFFEGTDQHILRWLALSEGRMVGYVFLWELHRSVPWLGICVAEDFKGKRLGRQLMQVAENHARTNGMGGILLTTHLANIRGQGLYERCGYERMGIHESGEILYLLRFDR